MHNHRKDEENTGCRRCSMNLPPSDEGKEGKKGEGGNLDPPMTSLLVTQVGQSPLLPVKHVREP